MRYINKKDTEPECLSSYKKTCHELGVQYLKKYLSAAQL